MGATRLPVADRSTLRGGRSGITRVRGSKSGALSTSSSICRMMAVLFAVLDNDTDIGREYEAILRRILARAETGWIEE
jgi:hypothetical protein